MPIYNNVTKEELSELTKGMSRKQLNIIYTQKYLQKIDHPQWDRLTQKKYSKVYSSLIRNQRTGKKALTLRKTDILQLIIDLDEYSEDVVVQKITDGELTYEQETQSPAAFHSKKRWNERFAKWGGDPNELLSIYLEYGIKTYDLSEGWFEYEGVRYPEHQIYDIIEVIKNART